MRSGALAGSRTIHPHKFNEVDLILKKVSQAQKNHRGKWAPYYEGPFVMKKAFSGGALLLASMDDE